MNTTVVENFRLAAALDYAARGWRVVPLHTPRIGASTPTRCTCVNADCPSIGKHPRTEHGLSEATADAETIRSWWKSWPAANVGIVMGPGTGMVALDVDPRNGGGESLQELCDTYGQLPETVEARTGGGGTHLLFAHPGGKVRNSKGKLGAGLDFKGDNGYIVAPPSLHASGERYAWLEDAAPGQSNLAPVPPWLLAMLTEPDRPAADPKRHDRRDDDAGTFWLGKALAKTTEGSRNDVGYWLAQQLRDARIPESEAERVLRDYAARVPRGDTPYTDREAVASVRSAYREPAREPAKSLSFAGKVIRASARVVEAKPKAAGASAELRAHFEDVAAGRVYDAGWPWPMFSVLTQSGLPGTTTTVVGDPGVGKTFAVIQALQHWTDNGIDATAFFIEKDRKFHTMRLLAQLESDGRFTNYPWVRDNPAIWDAALRRHEARVDQIGKLIWSSPAERVTLDSLLCWIRQQASAGKRVIVVDPITAVSAGDQRWAADDDFMLAAEKVMTAHGASLVLVTHSKKGNRKEASTGHDAAGGAAYFRFCDTLVWLTRPTIPKEVRYQTVMGPTSGAIPIFFQIHKSRNGRGSNHEIAMTFRELKYVEQGLVLGKPGGECRAPMAPADLGIKGAKPPATGFVNNPFDDEQEVA